MKTVFATFLFASLFTSLIPVAMSEELNSVDLARFNKFQLILKTQEEHLENQIRLTQKRVPKTLSEKLKDMRAGGDEKALNCIEIKNFFKIQQTQINKYLQFHHEVGLYKKISYQRFSQYDNQIIEYKAKALDALKSCRDLKDSASYLQESLEHLKEARRIIAGPYQYNNLK